MFPVSIFAPNQHDNADRPHHCDYLKVPLGDRSLRLDCHVFEPASTAQVNAAWANFTGFSYRLGPVALAAEVELVWVACRGVGES